MPPVDRSDDFVVVGYFLAACSDPSDGSPPAELSVPSWNHAYAAFYRALGAGRPLRSFSNSLKATRDTFDGWVGSARSGWRSPKNRNEPKPLHAIEQAAFYHWRDEPRSALWKYVQDFADLEVGQVPSSILADIESSEDPDGKGRTEGGRKVVVSSRVERDPSLRAEALRLHGHDCMVCSFNFESAYGDWGRDFAEVHHLELLAERPEAYVTNPETDLAVLCSNCHRMVHRRRDTVLDINELKAKLDTDSLRGWAKKLGE